MFQLFYLCLGIIDKSASKVLDSEEWEDISRELLEIILMRNTLRYSMIRELLEIILMRNTLRYSISRELLEIILMRNTLRYSISRELLEIKLISGTASAGS